MRALCGLVLVAALAGCSELKEYGAGPAFVAGDGGRGLGLVAEVAEGRGEATRKSSTFLETRGRALFTQEHQQLGGLVGLSSLRWVSSHAAISLGIGGGLGLEHAQDKVFWNAIAQARVGTGFLLSPSERIIIPRPTLIPSRCTRYERNPNKTLLDIGLASDVDGRFTRSAFYAFQLVLGIAFVEERLLQRTERVDCR